MKIKHKKQLQKIASNLLKVAEKQKVQYFSFYPDRFDASDLASFVERSAAGDWDYALVEKDGELQVYVSKGSGNSLRWSTGVAGNYLGLSFLPSGNHTYEGFEKFKRLAK